MKNVIYLHLCVMLGAFIPFGTVLIPYIYWKINKAPVDVFFDKQVHALLNFQLLFDIIFYGVYIAFWVNTTNDLIKWKDLPSQHYDIVLYIMGFAFLIWICYPLFVVVRIALTRKAYIAYPTIIPFFRNKTNKI